MVAMFDIVILGAGSGGLAAAKRAAAYGKKVAVIESDRTGGTCVIRGCVPKKLMSYASAVADTLADAHGYGFQVSTTFNDADLIEKRNAEVARLEDMHKQSLQKAGIHLYQGHGHFNPENAHQVFVTTGNNSETLEAENIIVATGGHPVMPPVPGHEHALTSDDVFALERLPKDIAIVGGGYIGVEFASIFNALGCNVHLIVRRNTMLGGFDDDIRQTLDNEMTKRGIHFQCVCNVEKIEAANAQHNNKHNNKRKKVTLDNGNVLDVDDIVMATGRKPNTATLCLQEVGVELDKAGAINVNGRLQAQGTPQNIYAIGDVTNLFNLTPVAVNHGRMVVDNLFNNKNLTTGGMTIPTAVFSIPQLGTVGLTQAQAEAKYGQDALKIIKTTFKPMINALPERDEKMLMKVIALQETEEIVGVHILGRDSAEMIQLIGMAMQAGLTLEHMHSTMPLHPSSAEEFVLLS